MHSFEKTDNLMLNYYSKEKITRSSTWYIERVLYIHLPHSNS